jgi:hypothetical protein
MSLYLLNNSAISSNINTTLGTLACQSLTVAGKAVGGVTHSQIPGGWIQTNSPVTIDNFTGTLLTNTGPLAAALFFNGSRLVLDLNGYITVGTPTSDVIDVYCTYTKNGGDPVPLTSGSQISNSCYSGCSCRVAGVTDDSFAAGDTLALQIYAKCQVNMTLAVGTESSSWVGTLSYY